MKYVDGLLTRHLTDRWADRWMSDLQIDTFGEMAGSKRSGTNPNSKLGRIHIPTKVPILPSFLPQQHATCHPHSHGAAISNSFPWLTRTSCSRSTQEVSGHGSMRGELWRLRGRGRILGPLAPDARHPGALRSNRRPALRGAAGTGYRGVVHGWYPITGPNWPQEWSSTGKLPVDQFWWTPARNDLCRKKLGH